MSQNQETFPKLDNGYANLTVNQTLIYGDVTLPQHAATKWYVDQEIKDLVSGAPDTLDTLKEIVDFIGDQNVSLDIVTRLSAAESSREEISEALHSEISKVTERIDTVSGELFTEISKVESGLDSLSSELSNTTHDLRTEIEQVSSDLSTEVGILEGKISELSSNVTVQIDVEVDKLETALSTGLAGKLDDGRVDVLTGDMVLNKIWGTSITNLTYHQEIVQIVSNYGAFAYITPEGHVKSWGDSAYGGAGSRVTPGVVFGATDVTKYGKAVQIVGNYGAFAIITENGYVMSVGLTDYGGSESSLTPGVVFGVTDVQGSGVAVQIVSNYGAFAFITENGYVMSMGDSNYGGVGGNTLHPLYSNSNDMAVQIVSNYGAFAFITKKGYVKSWGDSNYGGVGGNTLHPLYDDEGVTDFENSGMTVQIVSNYGAFAFITENGHVKSWGDSNYGGSDSGGTTLEPIYDKTDTDFSKSGMAVQIVGNQRAFAFITENGHVKSWGDSGYGGAGGTTLEPIYVDTDVQGSGVAVQIVSNHRAFAFTTENGHVMSWGVYGYGGSGTDNPGVVFGATDVTNYGKAVQIVGNYGAFAIITENGHVKSWGASNYGGKKRTTLESIYDETDVQNFGKAVQLDSILYGNGNTYYYYFPFFSNPGNIRDGFLLYVNETQQVERYRKMSPSRGGHFQVDETDAYLYIGNHWRIAANNNFENDGKKRLVFEYNQYDPIEETVSYDLLSSWIVGVPFIEN